MAYISRHNVAPIEGPPQLPQYHNFRDVRGVSVGGFNWALVMPNGTTFSSSCKPVCCRHYIPDIHIINVNKCIKDDALFIQQIH